MVMELMMMASKVPENSIKEATAAGMESVEQVLRLLSQTNLNQQEEFPDSSSKPDPNIEAVTDVAVNNFKKVISLLGRTRTGHARFRRAPVASSSQQVQEPGPSSGQSNEQKVSAFKVYQPTPIHRLPPLPHKLSTRNNDGSATTINFSNSPQISASTCTSFMSSLTGDTDSIHHSMSSGLPPLPSSSMKRKCNSMDDGALRCGSSSGRCHCSKKR